MMKPVPQGRTGIASLRSLGKMLVAPILTVALVMAFRDRFADIDLVQVGAQLRSIPAYSWALAAALTVVSYLGLGYYDAIAHRIFRTGIAQRQARRSGMAALAISQTLGLGVITGALARWRMLDGLGPARALVLSSFMAASFMCIWAWLTMAVLTAYPELNPQLATLARIGFFALTGFGLALCAWPGGVPRFLRRRLRRLGVGMRNIAGMAFYASIDMLAAGAVLFVLLDPAAGVPLDRMIPIFMVALGAGLLAGTPAGLGAFELTLLSLLPQVDPAVLLAAVTGYRVIYFVIPVTLATTVLAFPALIRPRRPDPVCEYHHDRARENPRLEAALAQADLAEAHLARQPGLGLMWSQDASTGAVLGEAGHSLVMLRDPFPASARESALDHFELLARQRGLTPCHYKCGPRVAALARRRGHQVMQIAREAWLDPAQYDITSRSRRQLRRKLRHAEKDGLRFEHCPNETLPLEQMARINADWAGQHGGERGFSMGRFHPAMLAHQRVYLAWQGAELRGFVSFHVTGAEWTLDLIRPARDARDGASHGLIHAALLEARSFDVPRLSLAAAPFQGHEIPDDTSSDPLVRLRTRLAARTGGMGLARFKSLFAPRWEPLYITAPSRWTLLRSGAEIARAVVAPQPFADEHERRSRES